ncbi:MAG: hypothetical protein MZV64_52850 [Ignavibacteriales bacterium]|nr:hypothetical protein [Ignavibacteriales bacterium]
MIFGILKYRWYIGPIAGVFLAIGVFSGIVGRPQRRRDRQGLRRGGQGHGQRGPDHRHGPGHPHRGPGRPDPGHHPGRIGRGHLQFPPARLGPDHVRLPVRHQLLRPFGHGPGGPDHPHHGSPRRPRRDHPADGRLRLPAGRVHQPGPADLGRDHGRPGAGRPEVGEVGQVDGAAAHPLGALRRPDPHPAGADEVGPRLRQPFHPGFHLYRCERDSRSQPAPGGPGPIRR